MITAKIIHRSLHCPMEFCDEFAEKNFGAMEGMTKDDALALWPDFFKQREIDAVHAASPGGESYKDVYDRVHPAIKRILRDQHESFAIVGHESVNRIIRGIIEGKSLEESVLLRQKNNIVIEYRFDEDREIVHEV